MWRDRKPRLVRPQVVSIVVYQAGTDDAWCILLGGSVAKLLLQYPDLYRVRALTRDPQSPAAKQLAKSGAVVVKADLTVPMELEEALRDCWGIFGVTNFYDSVRRPMFHTSLSITAIFLLRKSRTIQAVKNNKARTSPMLRLQMA